MTRRLIVRQRAEQQAAVARTWYDEETQDVVVGNRFLEELEVAVLSAHSNPLLYQKVCGEIRRVLLKKFPYAVFFVADDDRVAVLAVLRQSESPDRLRGLG
jgi:plasmid stabilization system protein ParE